jgi:hypothetical protein
MQVELTVSKDPGTGDANDSRPVIAGSATLKALVGGTADPRLVGWRPGKPQQAERGWAVLIKTTLLCATLHLYSTNKKGNAGRGAPTK